VRIYRNHRSRYKEMRWICILKELCSSIAWVDECNVIARIRALNKIRGVNYTSKPCPTYFHFLLFTLKELVFANFFPNILIDFPASSANSLFSLLILSNSFYFPYFLTNSLDFLRIISIFSCIFIFPKALVCRYWIYN